MIYATADGETPNEARAIVPLPRVFVRSKEDSMKSLRFVVLLVLAAACPATLVFAQAPTITTIGVKNTKCFYKAGATPCNIGPGMTININGSNFGKTAGGVSLCDCPPATVISWYQNRITVVVNSVTPNAGLYLETVGGSVSNAIPYTALGPAITSIVVGSCTYVPNQSPTLCKITPGTQFTINGSYFGPATASGYVITCSDCGVGAATINSWDPDWLTDPSPYNNQIEATATQAICGSTVGVFVDGLWSNYVPYTAC